MTGEQSGCSNSNDPTVMKRGHCRSHLTDES